MSTEPLTLSNMEPGEDPELDLMFDRVCAALQPDSRIPFDEAITNITELVPAGKPYSSEMGDFAFTCFALAEQIPYNHVLTTKLVTIIELVSTSPRFPVVDGSEDIQAGRTYQYQKLGETMRDHFNTVWPWEDRAKYVNFQTFLARVDAHGIFEDWHLEIYVVRCAFDEEHTRKHTEQVHETCVQAASQCLTIGNNQIYDEIRKGNVKPEEWRDWYDELTAVAAGKYAKYWRQRIRSRIWHKAEDKTPYGMDTIEMARQALVAMDAAQRGKTG